MFRFRTDPNHRQYWGIDRNGKVEMELTWWWGTRRAQLVQWNAFGKGVLLKNSKFH